MNKMIFSKKYVIHIKALKVLHQGLMLEKVHRATEFNQQVCLKPYIEMNVEPGTKAKNDFETDFFKLMNNSVFGKTTENGNIGTSNL